MELWLAVPLCNVYSGVSGMIPSQEASSYRPAVRPQRRREMVNELVAATPDVLNLLASLLQQPAGTAPTWFSLPYQPHRSQSKPIYVGSKLPTGDA